MDYFVSSLNDCVSTQDLCKKLKGEMLKCKISYFTGGEFNVHLEDRDLKNKTVYIVQSIFSDANVKAMELFLLANAIKNLGASNIIAIIPYLGYSRQDILNKGQAFSLQCLAKLVEVSDIKKIITIDLHNPLSTNLFSIPVVNLATASIFRNSIKDRENSIIIAPDVGATLRAKNLANMLGLECIVTKKERTKSGTIKIIDIPQIEAITGKDCYLVDDILDTGKTICAVAHELKKFKPKSIYALVSHGLFGSKAVQAVEKSCIEKIYVTNTVDCSLIKSPKICVLKMNSIIIDFLKNNRE